MTKGKGSYPGMQPTRVLCSGLADLPIEQIAQRARSEKWLIIQIPLTEAETADGAVSASAQAEIEKHLVALREQLTEHAVWERGFLRQEASATADNAPRAVVAQIHVWRFGTPEELDKHLDLLMTAANIYRDFANPLMHRLAEQLGEDVSKFAGRDYYWSPHAQSGMLVDDGYGRSWGYFFHGVDCCFGSDELAVNVEARLGCGGDFGIIERHFFWRFLSSYVRKAPKFLPVVELIHETKQTWEARRALHEQSTPDVLPFLLSLLERRGQLRCVTTYGSNPWDWIVVD